MEDVMMADIWHVWGKTEIPTEFWWGNLKGRGNLEVLDVEGSEIYVEGIGWNDVEWTYLAQEQMTDCFIKGNSERDAFVFKPQRVPRRIAFLLAFVRNVGIHYHSYTTSHLRLSDSSTTPLWMSQIWREVVIAAINIKRLTISSFKGNCLCSLWGTNWIFMCNFNNDKTFRGRAMTHASPCQICGGQNGTGTSFPTGFLVFRCELHSTKTLYISYSTRLCCSYRNENKGLSLVTRKKRCSFWNVGALDRKVLAVIGVLISLNIFINSAKLEMVRHTTDKQLCHSFSTGKSNSVRISGLMAVTSN